MANIGKNEEKDGWSWPEGGLDEDATRKLEEEVRGLVTPYANNPPPICYPGTTLDPDTTRLAAELISKQLNLIGTHTTGKDGEGGFQAIQAIEAAAVRMIASAIGGTPDTTDGYFCGGATEANIMGLWIGREWLRQRQDPMGRSIAVLATPLVHYSIAKAAGVLDLGHAQMAHCPTCRKAHLFLTDRDGRGLNLVGMDADGQMDMEDLKRVFEQKFAEGFRQFLVVMTVGTTVLGSIDPIHKIEKFAEDVRRRGANAYVHVDAAFGGFTVPFVAKDKESREIGFEHSAVMSVSLDGDKMGRLPYPAGIFLCRKGLQDLVTMPVNYVRGGHDDTLSGSRSALAPAIAYLLYKKEGRTGQAGYVRRCIEARDLLVALLERRFSGTGEVRVMPHSPYVNQVAIEIRPGGMDCIPIGRIEGAEKSALLAPYELRSDMFPSVPIDVDSCPRTIYKLVIMPHVIPHIERFVDDLTTFVSEYRR